MRAAKPPEIPVIYATNASIRAQGCYVLIDTGLRRWQRPLPHACGPSLCVPMRPTDSLDRRDRLLLPAVAERVAHDQTAKSKN